MLIDDGEEFNFLNKLIITQSGLVNEVIAFQSAQAALDYLQLNKQESMALPEIIFLDINMPEMDGWDFLDAFNQLKGDLARIPAIIMLTSSVNPDDEVKARQYETVYDYRKKPLLLPDLEKLLPKFL